MNKIMLQGRLVRDPEISPDHADDPKRMRCVFTAAVKRDYKRPDRPDTDFFRCVAFGPPASYLVRKGKKGDQRDGFTGRADPLKGRNRNETE